MTVINMNGKKIEYEFSPCLATFTGTKFLEVSFSYNLFYHSGFQDTAYEIYARIIIRIIKKQKVDSYHKEVSFNHFFQGCMKCFNQLQR